jgi:hypothetical protein
MYFEQHFTEIVPNTGRPGPIVTSVHDHTRLYLVCPDLMVAVGEASYGIRVGFIGSTHSLRCLFMYLFVFESKVYSYPLQQTKITFSQQKRK